MVTGDDVRLLLAAELAPDGPAGAPRGDTIYVLLLPSTTTWILIGIPL